MPTATTDPAGPIVIPSGASVDVTVNWELNPGSPDRTGHLTLVLGDTTVFDDEITVQGTPAETAPVIRLDGETVNPGDAVLSCDIATVTRESETVFRLA